MTFLTYIRLKAAATFLRFWVSAVPEPKADSVLQIPFRDDGRTIKVYVYKPSTPQLDHLPFSSTSTVAASFYHYVVVINSTAATLQKTHRTQFLIALTV